MAMTQQVVVSNLVDSNVFIRAIVLSLEFFTARRTHLSVTPPIPPPAGSRRQPSLRTSEGPMRRSPPHLPTASRRPPPRTRSHKDRRSQERRPQRAAHAAATSLQTWLRLGIRVPRHVATSLFTWSRPSSRGHVPLDERPSVVMAAADGSAPERRPGLTRSSGPIARRLGSRESSTSPRLEGESLGFRLGVGLAMGAAAAERRLGVLGALQIRNLAAGARVGYGRLYSLGFELC